LYQQRFGTVMGSPVSPLVANLFMEDLEQKAIATTTNTCKPRIWKRYVDDILAVVPSGCVQELNDHLNTLDITGNIKFTNETMENNQIPFLDANIVVKPDYSIKTTVYRKKTHTNQYLNYESHHPLIHKLGVVRTLLDRIDTVVSEPEDKMMEEKTVTDALTICGYPPWTFEKVKKQRKNKKDNIQKLPLKKNTSTDKPKGPIVLPYVKGLSE
jgi:hypothetical protein